MSAHPAQRISCVSSSAQLCAALQPSRIAWLAAGGIEPSFPDPGSFPLIPARSPWPGPPQVLHVKILKNVNISLPLPASSPPPAPNAAVGVHRMLAMAPRHAGGSSWLGERESAAGGELGGAAGLGFRLAREEGGSGEEAIAAAARGLLGSLLQEWWALG